MILYVCVYLNLRKGFLSNNLHNVTCEYKSLTKNRCTIFDGHFVKCLAASVPFVLMKSSGKTSHMFKWSLSLLLNKTFPCTKDSVYFIKQRSLHQKLNTTGLKCTHRFCIRGRLTLISVLHRFRVICDLSWYVQQLTYITQQK